MTKDMTEGKPFPLILQFVIPLILGGLLQQLYSIVDTVVVGRLIGSDALAAVGSVGSVGGFILGFCIAMCEGFAIPVAQQFGARNYSSMRCFVANSAWLCTIFSVIITAVSLLLCRPVLVMMKTPQDIFADAWLYIFIYLASVPFIILYNMLAGIIRALGDSRAPLLFLSVASVVNIVLDLLFVGVFHYGVGSTAAATLISQIASGVCCLFYIIRHYDILRMDRHERKFNSHYAILLCNVGIPMGLQCSITSIGSIILQTAINSLGTVYISAITAGGRLMSIFLSPLGSISSAMATFGGQNVGAGKLKRVSEGLRICLSLGAVYSVLTLLVFLFFSPQLLTLFVNKGETELLANARTYLLANGAFFIPVLILMTLRSLVQSMGFSRYAVFCGVFELIARIIISWILVPAFGYTAVCFANPLAWSITSLFLIPVYRYCMKKLAS